MELPVPLLVWSDGAYMTISQRGVVPIYDDVIESTPAGLIKHNIDPPAGAIYIHTHLPRAQHTTCCPLYISLLILSPYFGLVAASFYKIIGQQDQCTQMSTLVWRCRQGHQQSTRDRVLGARHLWTLFITLCQHIVLDMFKLNGSNNAIKEALMFKK
jgi:hypothetical protein